MLMALGTSFYEGKRGFLVFYIFQKGWEEELGLAGYHAFYVQETCLITQLNEKKN